MVLISVATPLASGRIFTAWLSFPNVVWLSPIPLLAAWLTWRLYRLLNTTPAAEGAKAWYDGGRCWLPFAITATLFILAFFGLAYSFFPYVVPESLTIWEAAASRDSLAIILVGTCITLPMIIGYSIFAYKVFGGKATPLTYH